MSDPQNSKSFLFGSTKINYILSFQDRKTLGVRVYPNCNVKVIAPSGSSEEAISKKLKSKAPWIIKQLNDFLSYHPLTPPRKYVNGETHLYLGRQYKLKVEKADFNKVTLFRGRLYIQKKAETKTEKLLTEWYREKARVHFSDTLQKVLPLFAKYKIETPDLHIRNMPTRWGSCTPQGKVILNPELIKAPKGSIEYVITHELCHLIHHNHTKAFYDLQDQMMPDWRKWKERLEYSLV
ncbi:M48 family metallopeptidase [Sunxiuqinia elliptica]|uniref:YgjP-like metallopeptidase domain-containing protein n=1 Tax=Sunxiuqinia elliptica TaxID=655355 RepID=A0A4V3BZ70_9BACT|nr:SprT family zinc-dependent metalloprotease [Sunxiuqinia elliptica]TDO05389.1 hypothetical protein DET52_101749 [Sunxiuqinia elliptica]TDO64936.1 hypothetical protein DET65_1308 [Sunxiuqinia elliptica]